MPFGGQFAIRKTKPRKAPSRSPLHFTAEELAHELGPRYQTIDARIGNQRLVYDIEQSRWTAGECLPNRTDADERVGFASGGTVGSSASSRGILKLEKTKRDLEEDNRALQLRINGLLQMLAEVIAESDVRRKV